jgi:hypothetical protein
VLAAFRGVTFSKENRRVSPALRVDMPVKAALPLPGAVAAFSMSRPMMKLVPCHSPGGMDTPSRDECMASSFESWYQASRTEDMGRSGKSSAPACSWKRHFSP